MASALSDFFGSESEDEGCDSRTEVSHHRTKALNAAVSLTLDQSERDSAIFTPETVERAVASLRNYGIAVIENLFDPEKMREIGNAALLDVEKFLADSDERASTNEDCVYLEFAARSSNRYEVRNGPFMQRAWMTNAPNLKSHPGLLSILRKACAAPGYELLEGQAGDNIVARDVGAFVSLPGAKSQAIHADLDHLYWHETLPPHAVTMFLPGCMKVDVDASEVEKVGWTSFFPRTHKIAAASTVLDNPPSQEVELTDDPRAITPSLKAGDAILYDARLLHRGEANKSTHTWRPLLYLTWVRAWFQDSQNWGTESLLRPPI
jgi:ectoine hydroxylase-related dioxygenase (phytanoyl-CoA dioxygenase family)